MHRSVRSVDGKKDNDKNHFFFVEDVVRLTAEAMLSEIMMRGQGGFPSCSQLQLTRDKKSGTHRLETKLDFCGRFEVSSHVEETFAV